jgi:Cytochrome b5-like Heme/Steroid binding domain
LSSSPSLKKLTALKKNKTTQPRSMRPSLLVLSAVWFALCCCLVWKKQQLSQIFFSFVSCFAAAGLLHVAVAPTAHKRSYSTWAISSVVGALCCAAALWACLRHRKPYTALALVAGYLAFDHWYRALHLTMGLSWGVVENAATLSVIVVWLATRHDDDDDSSSDDAASRMLMLENDGAFKVQAWILYKLTALLWGLARGAVGSSSTRSSAPPSLQETSFSDVPSPTSTNLPPATSEDQLWTIHGAQYDLRNFVARHPGGQQAILLGQGRDCTALFESYHPFTSQHRAVLQRYRQPTVESKETHVTEQVTPVRSTSATESPARDEFYQVLCERVAQTLQEKGIDPIRNRAATYQRTLYYIVVFVGVLATGWAHVRVSPRADQHSPVAILRRALT